MRAKIPLRSIFPFFFFLLTVVAFSQSTGMTHFEGPGVGSWGGLGPVVTGQPFCGDLQISVSQILADGNHIERTTTEHACRDSQGRTRTEREGAISLTNKERRQRPLITIVDPVAKVMYTLDPDNHTALRRPWHPFGVSTGKSFQAPKAARAISTPTLSIESLGEQKLDGVSVTGTRVTHTIPAGAIGNEQPIISVTETWSSPELQLPLLSKRTDPRSGESTSTARNITRTEPEPSIFRVPADYTIRDAPNPGARNLASRPSTALTEE